MYNSYKGIVLIFAAILFIGCDSVTELFNAGETIAKHDEQLAILEEELKNIKEDLSNLQDEYLKLLFDKWIRDLDKVWRKRLTPTGAMTSRPEPAESRSGS